MATKSKDVALAGKDVALAGKEAWAGTRAAGKALTTAGAKARTPLIAGGVAAGRSRRRARGDQARASMTAALLRAS